VKSPLNRRRLKASTDRYVLIKPYTYTLDFLPQILGDYPSVKSDQSLSAIRVGNPPNWSFRARSIRPHDTFVVIPNPRHPFLFHASIYIWSRMMRLLTLRKTTAIAVNPLQPGISDPPSPFLLTVAFNFPVCARRRTILYPHMYVNSCVDHVPLENSFVYVPTLYFHSLRADAT